MHRFRLSSVPRKNHRCPRFQNRVDRLVRFRRQEIFSSSSLVLRSNTHITA